MPHAPKHLWLLRHRLYIITQTMTTKRHMTGCSKKQKFHINQTVNSALSPFLINGFSKNEGVFDECVSAVVLGAEKTRGTI